MFVLLVLYTYTYTYSSRKKKCRFFFFSQKRRQSKKGKRMLYLSSIQFLFFLLCLSYICKKIICSHTYTIYISVHLHRDQFCVYLYVSFFSYCSISLSYSLTAFAFNRILMLNVCILYLCAYIYTHTMIIILTRMIRRFESCTCNGHFVFRHRFFLSSFFDLS